MPVSAGTLAGALQALAPLFEPVHEALYCRQMGEHVFHNDETRWEVFVEVKGKIGTRWYSWLTCSQSVIFYCIDPSRSAAVPGAHFAGLQAEKVIIVCDRYSAYKKLARLAQNILIAFCWAHVRRDFLYAGRAFCPLEAWALEWNAHIATFYHLNRLRLEQWDPRLTLDEQSAAFAQHHEALQAALECMHEEATRTVAKNAVDAPLSKSARTKQTNKSAHTLKPPVLQRVREKSESRLWNELIERYHYLGHKPLPGAQLRYLVYSADQPVALLGFGAAAWISAPRDHYIGWTHQQRKRQLHLVVNNARFLILPWIRPRNLASMLLTKAAGILPDHWQAVYGYRPVLLETFVEKPRFQGTCYKAANWIYLGQTKGRGKLGP